MSISSARNNNSHRVDEENPYWISFSDIMAGLLIIFILATLHLILELTETSTKVNEKIEELLKINEKRSEMLNRIKDELIKKGIKVEVVERGSVIRIPNEQLSFRQNRYSIPENKTYAVNVIGEVVYKAIIESENHNFIDTVFIEGHTDSVPAPRYKMGNWELSADRAISIWNHWRENKEFGEGIASLRNIRGEFLFSVSGYAETRRVIEDDDTPDKQKQNRRIDLRFTMKLPELGDLKDIKKLLGND